MQFHFRPRRLQSIVLATLFFALPPTLAFVFPISFWAGNDNEPLGLANAFNFAFRLADHVMYPADGMTNHPGLPFYFLNWSALALAGFPIASSPLDFFRAVTDHIRTYQLFAITLSALVGAASVYLFARATSPFAPGPVILVSLLLWLLSTPASLTTFLSPSDESFALAVNAIFLCSLLRIAHDDRGTIGTFAFAAAVSAFAYLNKLPFMYVAVALGAAMIVQYVFTTGVVRLSAGFAVFGLTTIALVVAAGKFLIGWPAFRGLLYFHRSVALGSGLYGEGDGAVISTSAVLNAVQSIPSDRTFSLPLAMVGGMGLLLIATYSLLRTREPRPELTVAIGCGVASLLSAVVVLKHYAPHYSAGVSATLPGCVFAYHLLLKKRFPRSTPVAAAIITLLVSYPVVAQLQSYIRDRTEFTRAAALDRSELGTVLASQKKVVDYVYRVPFREYGEGLVITYAGVKPLTDAYTRDRRGTTNSLAEALVSEDVGAYVIDKNYFRTEDAVKTASNIDLLGPKPVRYQDGDTLIELRTVFVLLRRAAQ
ncbi:hypothetical protein ABIB73_003746 [Bradyrhizobium sp. F1.4.3]|uniref:hypothetical protein n=1 Tax=Bradyrhizobium sp. F1.4.3 TaxID=3156356 RepID=UPI00339B077D